MPKKYCKCGKEANHWEGNKGYCCKCWVDSDNPPADWHPDCLRAEKNKARRIKK
jgi:hypothetical protein